MDSLCVTSLCGMGAPLLVLGAPTLLKVIESRSKAPATSLHFQLSDLFFGTLFTGSIIVGAKIATVFGPFENPLLIPTLEISALIGLACGQAWTMASPRKRTFASLRHLPSGIFLASIVTMLSLWLFQLALWFQSIHFSFNFAP